MRRPSVLAAALLLVLAFAPSAHAQSTGGAEYQALAAPRFAISPTTIAPGAPLTITYRVSARAKRVRVRVDLLAGGAPQATLHLGRKRTRRTFTATWRPQLAPGRYTARLRATTLKRIGRARASSTSTIEIQAPAITTATGVFPVQGAYSLGGAESRFGAERSGHVHQGQDISAAAGTPVVAPRTGFVSWRAYQAEGAGYYVVLHGDDARDYVFMHLQGGSVVVEKGDYVTAGEAIGAVGSSGASSGPHLHFEIWPDGWYASKTSRPIDPLPDLLAWAGG